MVVVATLIGILGGFGAVGFRMMIDWTQVLFWGRAEHGAEDGSFLAYIEALSPLWKVAAPTIGMLIVGFICYYFAREARGHGVPEVMEAVALKGGRIRPRVVIAKLFASCICIASGGSVGREGPQVQVGASLGSTVGQWLRIDERRLRTLVGAGAAAGIAGTFNAPIAGALFAVEVILGDFGVPQFSPIVIASVAATVISRSILGDHPAFLVPEYELINAGELFIYALLGILAGFVALGFVRGLYGIEDLWDKLKVYPPFKAAIGGALIGVIGLYLPQIYGVGYEAIEKALHGEMTSWHLLLLLMVVKIAAVGITLGSGGSGGVFAPSLFIGAMLGGAVGLVANAIWPDSTASTGAYALVGMGAVVAAGTHAPITAILIIFELTGDYKIILPLMISCIISTLMAMNLQKSSIYTLKLLRRGVDIKGGLPVNVLRHLSVRDVIRTDVVTVSPDENLSQLVSMFINHPHSCVFVVDPDNKLLGMITVNEIRPIMTDLKSMESLLIARDMMVTRNYPFVRPTDNLDDVMKRLGTYRGEVPVMDQNGELAGAIWPEDVIHRYNQEIFKRDMANQMVSSFKRDEAAPIPGTEAVSVAEILVPTAFHGKTLSEANIRAEYNITVLLIKRRVGMQENLVDTVPNADYEFQDGDVMLALGPNDQLRRLQMTG